MVDTMKTLNVALDLLNDLAETVASDPEKGQEVVDRFWNRIKPPRDQRADRAPAFLGEIGEEEWERLEEGKRALVEIGRASDLAALAEAAVTRLRESEGLGEQSWKPIAYRMLLSAIMNRIAEQENRRPLDAASRSARERILEFRTRSA